MSDPKIRIRRSSTPNKVPTITQLELGELAINTYDGKLYLEQDQGASGVGNTVVRVNPWNVGLGTTAYNISFTSGKVGIGTTVAQYNLDVGGNINFTGSLFQDGSAFTSGVGIRTAGGTVGYAATIIDFRGPGVTTAYYSSTTGVGTVYFQGGGDGGANVSVGSNPPSSPSGGDLWWDSDVGELYIYYSDTDSNQWVETSGGSETVTVSDDAPSSPNSGDLWWESDTGQLKIYYQDANSAQWVDANAGVLSQLTVWQTNSTGINTSSNVGIGTTTADAALTVDGNVRVTGISTFSDDIVIPDNKKLILGTQTGRQLQLYHNTTGSSNHVIESTSSSNHLIFKATTINPRANTFSFRNHAHNKNVFRVLADTSTTLYYNGNAKLTTENTGVNITGVVTATSANINGNITLTNTYPSIFLVDSDHDDDFSIQNQNGLFAIRDETNSANRFTIGSDGQVKITGVDDQDNLVVNGGSTQFAVHQDDTDGEVSLRAQDGSGNNYTKYMTFFTEGGSGPTERLRIEAAGNTDVKKGLRVSGEDAAWTSGSEGAFMDYYASGSMVRLGHVNGASGSAKSIVFYSGGSEKVRFTSGGRIGINESSPDSDHRVTIKESASGDGVLVLDRTSNIDGTFRSFVSIRRSGTVVGSIKVNNSATQYNTSSDHRLKENVVTMSNAIDRLKQLQPKRFNFILNPDTTVDGFLAHEVQSVVPEAISGTKDEVDSDNNPVYQGIDQSKLVPLLTAALQEAITKIETLETKVATLEGS